MPTPDRAVETAPPAADVVPSGRHPQGAAAMGVVLVVEDEPDVSSLLTHHLDRLGYTCLAVATAEAALRLETASFDLAVVDLMLPGMNGQELIGELRGRPLGNRLPIIATSVLSRNELVAAAADSTLTKPFRSAQLTAAVDAARRARRALLDGGSARGAGSAEGAS